jgi:hypothetical protein
LLTYPDWYVLNTWLDYKRHGLYPEPGGYNNQDMALMDDWGQITLRYNWLFKQIEPELEERKPGQKRGRDAFDELIGSSDGDGAFEDLFG